MESNQGGIYCWTDPDEDADAFATTSSGAPGEFGVVVGDAVFFCRVNGGLESTRDAVVRAINGRPRVRVRHSPSHPKCGIAGAHLGDGCAAWTALVAGREKRAPTTGHHRGQLIHPLPPDWFLCDLERLVDTYRRDARLPAAEVTSLTFGSFEHRRRYLALLEMGRLPSVTFGSAPVFVSRSVGENDVKIDLKG